MIRIVSHLRFEILLGQVGFEPTANRLKAEYSTTELLTLSYRFMLIGLCIEYKLLSSSSFDYFLLFA